MRTETANEPFEEDLKDGCCDQGVKEADGGIVDVPERSDADLADEEDGDGDEGSEECCCPDGDDFFAEWVCEFGVDDFAVLEVDGEGSGGSWVRCIYLEQGC